MFFRERGNVKRLREIVYVFLKYGFTPLIERLHLYRVVSIARRLRLRKEAEELSLPERLRLAFEELGPTFIKLGQLLSARPDILPDEYIQELRKLLDEVPPVRPEEIVKAVETELELPIGAVFKRFERRPVAAASIAQVHLAVLHDGREVAVKIQRPGIKETIEKDIAILRYIARLIDRYIPESRLFNPTGIVDEFARMVAREMDFLLEASSMERMSSLVEEEDIIIPEVVREYTTKKVLTMERLRGMKVDHVEGLMEAGIDPGDVARRLAEFYLKQILIYGFFHADPHPGNIFVREDGKIGLCDFGIMGRLSGRLKEGLADLMIAVINMDYEAIPNLQIALGVVKEEVDVEELKEDMRDLLAPYHGRPLREINPAEVFSQIIRIGIKYGIRLPKEFMLLDKTFLVLDSLLRTLDPEIVLLEIAKPFAIGIIRERKRPEKALSEFLQETQTLQAYMREYPSQIHRLLKKMVEDRFTVDFTHRGLENFIGEMDRSSNRLTFGLIVSSLIVGSALIILSGEGPKIYGFSALGIITFGLGALLGFLLTILILRSGKY